MAAVGLVATGFLSWKDGIPSFSSVSVPSAEKNRVEISTEEWQLWQEFIELLQNQSPPPDDDDDDESKRGVFQIPFDQIPKKKRSKRKRKQKLTREQPLVLPDVESPLQMTMEESQVGTEQLQESTKKEQHNANACHKHNLKDSLENDDGTRKNRASSASISIEDLPASFSSFIEQMGGTNPILVVQKQLYKSDINPDQNRFLIPRKRMKDEFLTAEESRLLESYHKNKYTEGDMRVVMIEPSLGKSTMSLRVWNAKSRTRVLVKDWKLVVKRNGLKIGDRVQLWSFRIGTQLCFALLVSGSDLSLPH